MGIAKAFAAAAAFATLASAARNNLVMYWGQGPSQDRLSHFCENNDADIIPIGFMNFFPANANGWGGTNFGNQCWGYDTVYSAPGYHGLNDPSKNKLLAHCANLAQDIQYCQSKGKKILLSLGGGHNTYTLTGHSDGEMFAEFLWKSFGPVDQDWLDAGGVRPWDPLPGTEGGATIVDGFDFDIEFASTDNSAGYIGLINKLRSYFPKGSDYLITGAPQCVVNDVAMDQMINNAKFDIIWVQFYNTKGCSLRDWVTANPNYLKTNVEDTTSGFSFDKWYNRLRVPNGASKDAKLVIGTLGSTGATTASGAGFYLSPDELAAVIRAYYCKPNFGGIMIWEATYADNNKINGVPFQSYVKAVLNSMPNCPGDPTSTVTSTTTSASSSTSSTAVTTASSSTTTSASSSTSSTAVTTASSSTTTSASSSTSSTAVTTASSSSSSSSIVPMTTTSSTSSSSIIASTTEASSTSSEILTTSTTSSAISSTAEVSATSTSSSAISSSAQASSTSSIASTSSVQSTTNSEAPSSTSGSVTITSSIEATSTSSEVQTTTSADNTRSTAESSSSSSSTTSPSASESSIESSISVTAPLTTGPSTTPIVSTTAPYANSSIPLSTIYPTLTSTIITTSVYTVTSCAPTVTSCTKGAVKTATITSYSTYCPAPVPTSAPISISKAAPVTDYTTSTVFTTIVYTVTACPLTVPSCPQGEKTTYVTTQTKFLYTTVCPVVPSSTSTTPAAAVVVMTSVPVIPTPAVPAPVIPTSPAPAPVKPSSKSESYTTLSSTTTSIIYVTVPASKSYTTTQPVVLETHYVVPTPKGEVPIKPTGTGAITKPSGAVFTGSASRVASSVFAAAIVGLAALMM